MNINKIEDQIIPSLPEGKGNNLMHARCPSCGVKRNFWAEVGDNGCVNKCVKDGRVKTAPPKLTPEQKRIAELKEQIANMEKEKPAATESKAKKGGK
jgi:hypothetical protein